LDVVDPWDETIEPDWFAMPTPLRTSRSSCSRVELPLLTHVCHRAWSYLLRAAPVLLPYPWPSTCSCVACCLARAHVCRIEPSRPSAEHFCSHSRTCQSKSAWTSGSCNSAALSICCDAIRAGLLPPPVLCCASNPRRVTPAPTSAWMRGARRALLRLAPPSSSHPIAAFALPPSPSDLPRHNRPSASVRDAVCLH
jgi:hypothetical protein